jgi:hypothetical protein
MMGERTVAQEALFYGFSLERHVPPDHLLRSIDRFVDLTEIREHLRPFYSERRSVREFLDTLDDAAWGTASEVKPKFVSRSDPAAQWTGAYKGHAFFAYATNYLIDLDHAVIVDVEPSRAIRQAEVGATRTMIDRTQDRFGLYPRRLAADSAYGSAENLTWLVRSAASSRTSQSSTGHTGRTAPSSGPTSPSTMRPTPTPAPPASSSGSDVGTSALRVRR